MVITKIISYVSSLKTAAKEQYEFRKAIWETTNQISSKTLTVFKELQLAYLKVGDSAAAKQSFINKYADKIKETGLNINTVKQAEDAFINNTGKYVEAITSRAKAQAIEQQAIKLYEEYLNKRSELEDKLATGEASKVTFGQSLLAGSSSVLLNDVDFVEKYSKDAAKRNKETVEKELSDLTKDINERLQKMFEDVAVLNKKYGGFFNTTIINNNIKEVKDKINELDNFLKEREESPDALEDRYNQLLSEAIKQNRGLEEIEIWHNEELKKIRDKEREDEEKARKEASDKRWNDFQAELKRIRDLASTSNLKDPQQQVFQTDYKQNFAKLFGLSGDFTYQSRDDLQNQYEAQITYNDEIFRSTRDRILQENELLNEQLSNEQLSAERREEIERTLSDNRRALSDAAIKNEQDNTNAYQHLQKARQQALQATLSVASNVAGNMAQI